MQKILAIGIAVMLVTACSSPKYTYYFDHYDYNSGKPRVATSPPSDEEPVFGPIEIDMLVASTNDNVAPAIRENAVLPESNLNADDSAEEFRERYNAMSKSGKRAFRKSVKEEMKTMLKKGGENSAAVSPDASAQMDNDLKLAIIFGAVGLTLSLFSGINAAFWVLGVIAIVVGVVFLIRWLVRQ